MNIKINLRHTEPGLRELEVVVDSTVWYHQLMHNKSGLIQTLHIGEHQIEIEFDGELEHDKPQ